MLCAHFGWTIHSQTLQHPPSGSVVLVKMCVAVAVEMGFVAGKG